MKFLITFLSPKPWGWVGGVRCLGQSRGRFPKWVSESVDRVLILEFLKGVDYKIEPQSPRWWGWEGQWESSSVTKSMFSVVNGIVWLERTWSSQGIKNQTQRTTQRYCGSCDTGDSVDFTKFKKEHQLHQHCLDWRWQKEILVDTFWLQEKMCRNNV